MISAIVYGRNDGRGYGMEKRVAIGLNTLADQIDAGTGETLFVDYNTDDHLPTLPELIRDDLTDAARRRTRVLRVRRRHHARFADLTPLPVLEAVARNVALRRSRQENAWILLTNTDAVVSPVGAAPRPLHAAVADLAPGVYSLPRLELPERVWEGFDRRDPAACRADAARWSVEARLAERVRGVPSVLFDNPGDFQLVPRAALFAIDGLDEAMLLGWHVDHNLLVRLAPRLGPPESLEPQFTLHHCGHARQPTLTHGPGRAQNDVARFVCGVEGPELPAQRDLWGLIDEAIEEVDLSAPPTAALRAACVAAMEPLTAPLEAVYAPESFDDFGYDAGHAAAHLLDLLSALPRDAVLGVVGARGDFLEAVLAGLAALGFVKRVLVAEEGPAAEAAADRAEVEVASFARIAAAADAVVFEFGLPNGRRGPPEGEDAAVIARLLALLQALADDERRRVALGADPRLTAAVNAVHNRCEAVVGATLLAATSPFTTRLRHGWLAAPGDGWRRAAAQAAEALGRTEPISVAELAAAREGLRLLTAGPPPPKARLALAAHTRLIGALLAQPQTQAGFDAATMRAAEARLRAAARPDPRAAAAAAVQTRDETRAGGAAGRAATAMASLRDWEDADWRRAAAAVRDGEPPRDAWVWERAQIVRALDGMAAAPARLAVLGAMPEALRDIAERRYGAAVAADVGRALGDAPVQNDGYSEGAEPFDAVVAPHAAAFRAGAVGVVQAAAWAAPRLAPGGLFLVGGECALLGPRRGARPDPAFAGPDGFSRILAETLGLDPIGAATPPHGADLAMVGDPADAAAGRPMLGLAEADDVLWPCVWAFRRTAAPARPDAARTALAARMLGDVSGWMRLGRGVSRDDAGRIAAAAGRPLGSRIVFGPYLPLPPGRYVATVQVAACAAGALGLQVEVALGPRVVAKRRLAPARGAARLRFSAPDPGDRPAPPCQIRLWSARGAAVAISAMRVEPA